MPPYHEDGVHPMGKHITMRDVADIKKTFNVDDIAEIPREYERLMKLKEGVKGGVVTEEDDTSYRAKYRSGRESNERGEEDRVLPMERLVLHYDGHISPKREAEMKRIFGVSSLQEIRDKHRRSMEGDEKFYTEHKNRENREIPAKYKFLTIDEALEIVDCASRFIHKKGILRYTGI